MPNVTATLLVSCPDEPGLVARFAHFIFNNGGNIIHSDQHTDFQAGLFLTRLEWQLEGFRVPRDGLADAIAHGVVPHSASWKLEFSDRRKRVAIWVSKQDHCLYDLLLRHKSGEIDAEIVAVVSNHADLRFVADQMNIPFHHFPLDKDNKARVEAEQLVLMREEGVDLIVLAKYMQILSADFLAQAPTTLNIHHSFLPAFAGANPYHRAHERGVKIIGATAHYVTPELDAGPIIAQDVVHVSHRDTVADLIREGKDIERVVLARAVRSHLQNRVLVYGNKTVVFD